MIAEVVTRRIAFARPDTITKKHPIEQLETLLVIGIGGFAGSNMRYFLELVLPNSLIATGTVNIIGCLALGFVFYEEFYSNTFSRAGQTLLGTGVIASFTTYSTFAVDTALSTPGIGILYVVLSYLFGFIAVLIGRFGAKLTANKWSETTMESD